MGYKKERQKGGVEKRRPSMTESELGNDNDIVAVTYVRHSV